MKKKVFIASFDLEVGGVERSLISMLKSFDYENNDIDLVLYKHSGEFFKYLDKRVNLLKEDKTYKTIREGIGKIFKEGNILLGLLRLGAKIKGKRSKSELDNVMQLQYMSKYSMYKFPKINGEYDIAISYLWPHHFVVEKVEAKTKVAWIHTDYSMIHTDEAEDIKVWSKYDYIIAVSNECKEGFLRKYESLREKVIVLENISSPKFIKETSIEKMDVEFRKEDFNIVTVGRLSYPKGIERGIYALKKLHDKGFKNIKWFVIGYGEDEEKLRKLIKELSLEGSFNLLMKKINPYPYMENCDLYVQPSRYEGKPVTITEAQILGKPVMVTNYKTARDSVEHLYDGYICENSIEGIAEGIEKLISDKEILRLLSDNCKNINYENNDELEKLYKIIKE